MLASIVLTSLAFVLTGFKHSHKGIFPISTSVMFLSVEQLLQDINATHAFLKQFRLSGLLGLVEAERSQRVALEEKIQRTRVEGTTGATAVIAAFNAGIEIWEVSNREALCRAAIERSIAGPGAAKHNDCQVFTNFHCFCKPSLFRLIQNKDISMSTKIMEVAKFLAQLGLCKPCPQSRRSVVGCVYFSMHGIAAAAPEFGSECLSTYSVTQS